MNPEAQQLEVPQGWMIRRWPTPSKHSPRIAHLLFFCDTAQGVVETSACKFGPQGYFALDYRAAESGDRKCKYCLALESRKKGKVCRVGHN